MTILPSWGSRSASRQDGDQQAIFIAEMAKEGDFIHFSTFGDRFGGGFGDATINEEFERRVDQTCFGGLFCSGHRQKCKYYLHILR